MSVESDLDKKVTYGDADGPDLFVDQFGFVVPTFINPRNDLIPGPARAYKRVSHHVPFKMRGFFKPEDWPDDYRNSIEWRVNNEGFVLCSAIAQKTNKLCSNKAVNRENFCRNHGGGLHPLDKKISSQNVVAVPQERVDGLDRAQKFMQGFLSIEDLSDEEIQGMFIYDDTGRKVQSLTMGIKIHQQIAQELHRRMNRFLQTKTASMLSVMVDIAESDLVEPADRIKAATWVAERTMGKTPDVIIHGKVDAPYESIFEAIDAGSREDYRQKISSSRLDLGGESDEIIDAETLEESEDSDCGENDSGQADSGNSEPDPDPSLEYAQRASERRNELDRQQAIKKARAKAKQRRFAARAVGATTTQDLPWIIEWKFDNGTFRMKLVCPEEQTQARLDKVTKSNAEALEKAELWRNSVA